MTELLADVIAFERASLQVGEALVGSLLQLLTSGSDEGGPDDPLTPQQHQQIRLLAWRLQNAFEEIMNPRDPDGLRAALSAISVIAEKFSDQLVAWTEVMDDLVEEAERLYGTESGRGAYKRAQVRAAVLTIARGQGITLPMLPDFLEPFVFAYGADVMADFVVTHLNTNGLWDLNALPPKPKMSVRVGGPLIYYGQRSIEFLNGFLTKLAWLIVMQSVRLSPGMSAAVKRIRPDIAATLQAFKTLAQFLLNNPNYVRAWAQVLSIATQQAEAFIGMSGPRKQAFARALILAFLEQNGVVGLGGLWRQIVSAWIDVGIDATVRLFNRRRLFPFRSSFDVSEARARALSRNGSGRGSRVANLQPASADGG